MKASLIGLIMVILALAAIAPASLDAQTSARLKVPMYWKGADCSVVATKRV